VEIERYLNIKPDKFSGVVLAHLDEVKLDIDDEGVRKTPEDVEANAKTQIDPLLINTILDQMGSADGGVKKEVVIKALLAFTWGQRLYFIIRSAMMGLMGAVMTAGIVLFVGEVNALQVGVISVASFIATLAITRLFDARITAGSKRIVSSLSRHKRLRSAILNHF
jgi:hypothetical protein